MNKNSFDWVSKWFDWLENLLGPCWPHLVQWQGKTWRLHCWEPWWRRWMTSWLKVNQITHGTKWYCVNVITVGQTLSMCISSEAVFYRDKCIFPWEHQQPSSHVSILSTYMLRYRSFCLSMKIRTASSNYVCMVIYHHVFRFYFSK